MRRFTFTAMLALTAVACGGGGPGGPSIPGDDTELPPGVDAADPEAPTGGVNGASALSAPYVVLVSLDGFASRYLGQYDAPALEGLATRGVLAPDGMIPAYPTKTFPNHYTLATGMYPASHGIVSNTFFDPGQGAVYSLGDISTVTDGTWYGGEPMWVTAERQGMVAATFYWVGSEAAIGGVRPSHWRSYDAGVPNDTRVDQVLDWLAYPEAYRPHLVLLYMSTTDQVGHAFGPDSPQMRDAVASVDASIGRLVDGVAALDHGDDVSVIVLSDHGMDGWPAESTRYLADVVDLTGLTIPESGTAANVFVDGGNARAEEIRDAVNTSLEDVTAYLTSEVPERLHHTSNARLGDLILMPDSGHVVWPVNDRPPSAGYSHGWDNALLSMRALFLAVGPEIPVGVDLEPFEAIHVYPLVTRLLGLSAASNIDGSEAFWDAALSPVVAAR